MNVLELFAGIGGFGLALERAGATVIGACEIDTAARGVYADHWPHVPLHPDVTELTADDLGTTRVDLIAAGFPCQDLSVAGRRQGLRGSRSGLFWEIVRLADETRPRWLILENVPGLLSSNSGRDMGIVLGALGDLGYGWAYRVLDAQHFGVPQRRRRVFIVGCLGDGAAPVEVLLEPEGRDRDPQTGREARSGVAATLTRGSDRSGRAGRRAEDDVNLVVSALTANGLGGGGPDDNLAQAHHVVAFSHTAGIDTQASEHVTPTIKAGHNTMPAALTATAVRRLTPLECERLQGFPDGWTATSNGQPQADLPRYRQLGNAVAVPVVEWIARRLVATDGEACS